MSNIDGGRRRLLVGGAAVAATFWWGIRGSVVDRVRAALQPIDGAMPSFDRATAWLNTQPLTPDSLRGKVVLVDFWTYTCINWLRTLPYVRAWSDRYRAEGLVVIGVHSPEFAFEKNIDNVRWAVTDRGITYPIALDNPHAIWGAFANHYWPALYLMDGKGNLRHRQFGEGNYEEAEKKIRALLAETGQTPGGSELVSVDVQGVEVEADWKNLSSPENYLGYGRTEGFASPGGVVRDRRHAYTAPSTLRLNQWALAGDWTVTGPASALNAASGRLTCRFHARDLHLVMGPAAPGMRVRFQVRLDGQPAGASHGTDVDADGYGTLVEQRLYQLIRQQGPIRDRLFEIRFEDTGAETFAFTFG